MLIAVNRYRIEQIAFSRVIVYYPVCGGLWQWKPKVPVLMLLASEDRVAPTVMCQDAAKESAIPDVVKMLIYPGALHCFDMPELPQDTYFEGGRIGYHPQAAAAAWEEIERFL